MTPDEELAAFLAPRSVDLQDPALGEYLHAVGLVSE